MKKLLLKPSSAEKNCSLYVGFFPFFSMYIHLPKKAIDTLLIIFTKYKSYIHI